MIWTPHVTVAALVENNGKYLLVEEQTSGGLVFNQPAGHWENGETLLEAVKRETLEETAYDFDPTNLLGIYHWKVPGKDTTYLRFCFTGSVSGPDKTRQLDQGIVRAIWSSHDELQKQPERLRSPLVLQCINDYEKGQSFPLELIQTIP